MFGLIAVAIALTAAWMGYGSARRFVRERLRYVEAAQSGFAPIIAGLVAAAISYPIVSVLIHVPLIHSIIWGGTWLAIGTSVGLGVRAGAADVKRGYLVSSGS
jgi:hypothetical protein